MSSVKQSSLPLNTHRLKWTSVRSWSWGSWGSVDWQQLNCGGNGRPIDCGGSRKTPISCLNAITLTTLLKSPAVTIDRKDCPRYSQALTYSNKHLLDVQAASVVTMWHLWEDLTYIGKIYETKRYETTRSRFNWLWVNPPYPAPSFLSIYPLWPSSDC